MGCDGQGERADEAGEALRQGIQSGGAAQRGHPEAAALPQQVSPVQVPGKMDGVPEGQGGAAVRHISRHSQRLFPLPQAQAHLLEDKGQGCGIYQARQMVQRCAEVRDRHLPDNRGDDIQSL